MRRRNLADLGSALPLLVAAATALAAFGFLAAAGARSSPAAAPAPTPRRAPNRREPAGLVSRVRGVDLLPTRVSLVPGVSPALAWGGGRLWAPAAEGLERISPVSLAASTSSRFYGTCGDAEVAYGAGGIWVTEGDCSSGAGMVYEFDRRTRLRRSIRLPAPAIGVGVGGGRVWVTTTAAQNSRWAVVRIDPASGRAAPVGGPFDSSGDTAARYGAGPIVPAGSGRFWTVCSDGGAILMTASPVGAIAGVVKDGDASVTGLAFGDGAVWAALGLAVQRLDPQTGRRDGTVLRPPSSPVAVAFGQGEVWVATSGYEVYGFRPGATSMEQVGRLTFEPSTLLDADGYLWATDGQTLARIGPVAAGGDRRPATPPGTTVTNVRSESSGESG